MSLNNIPHLIAITLIVYFSYKQLSKAFGVFYLPKNDAIRFNAFYQKYLGYYNKLSSSQKKRFLHRVYSLLKSIKIIGRQGFKVSEQEKLLVVASIVQLTFGFKYYTLPRFKTFFIYPDSYKSPITGKLHDGEVHPRGLIVLSWKKLVKGHAVTNDNINLGLHEMAHALMHTIIYTNNHEPNLDSALDQVLNLSEKEIEKINSEDFHLFRSYAATNKPEFFAVAVEHFFEGPIELKNQLPDLYNSLKTLLKQDPAANQYQVA